MMAFQAGLDLRFLTVVWGGIKVQFGWSAGYDAVGTFHGTGQFYIQGNLIEEYTIDAGAFDVGYGWGTDNIKKFLQDNDIPIPEDNVIELTTNAHATFTNAEGNLSKSPAHLFSQCNTNKFEDQTYTSSGLLPECGFEAQNVIDPAVGWQLNIKTGEAHLLFSVPS